MIKRILYYIFLFIFLTAANIVYSNITFTPEMICSKNLYKLEDAVKRYNKEHETKIEHLSKFSIRQLVEKKYLDQEPFTTHYKCKYLGDNLDKNGVVYCEYHGNVDRNISPSLEYMEELEKKDREEKLISLWPVYVLLILGMIAFGMYTVKKKV